MSVAEVDDAREESVVRRARAVALSLVAAHIVGGFPSLASSSMIRSCSDAFWLMTPPKLTRTTGTARPAMLPPVLSANQNTRKTATKRAAKRYVIRATKRTLRTCAGVDFGNFGLRDHFMSSSLHYVYVTNRKLTGSGRTWHNTGAAITHRVPPPVHETVHIHVSSCLHSY